MYKKGWMLCVWCLMLSLLAPGSLMAQTTNDIRGEAHIIKKQADGKNYLVNYDREFEIDNSFTLNSTSYVYLSVKTDAEIRSIEVAGMLRIQGDDSMHTLTVGGTDVDVAIKCGALDIRENINISSISISKGIESGSFIEISCGEHILSSHGAPAGSVAVSAASFIMLTECAGLYTYNKNTDSGYFETGINTGTQLIVSETSLNSHAVKAGINCAGGIHLKKGAVVNAEADLTVAGSYGISVSGRNNIIAEAGSVLSGSGNIYGITSEEGIIRADNATIQGTRYGIGTDYLAVSAPGKIYAFNESAIRETYKASNVVYDETTFLTTYPVFQHNMTSAGNYVWTQNGDTLRAIRRKTYPEEKVKLVNNDSYHLILLEESSGGPQRIPVELCMDRDNMRPTYQGEFIVIKPVNIYSDPGVWKNPVEIPVEDIEEAIVIVTWPNGDTTEADIRYAFADDRNFGVHVPGSIYLTAHERVDLEFRLKLYSDSPYVETDGGGGCTTYIIIQPPN